MKKILLIIVVFLLLLPSNKKPLVEARDIFEDYNNEGMVAFNSFNLNLTEDIVDNTVIPTPICGCNGTKKERSGDGLIEVPCVCMPDCKCVKKDVGSKCQCGCGKENCTCSKSSAKSCEVTKQVATTVENPIYYSYFFSAPWCTPCNKFHNEEQPQLEKLDWKFGKNKWSKGINVVNVNIDENPLLSAEYDVQLIPKFVVVRNGRKLDERSGFMTYKEFAKFHNDTINKDKANRR